MKPTKLLFFTFACLLLLCGCRSSRRAATNDGETGASILYPPSPGSRTTPSVKTPEANNVQIDALTAKMNLVLEAGGKRVNVGGTYRLKRNDVIQMNLTYTMIFTISVGTLELTRDYILLLDRINKRYCKVSYSEVPSLAQAGIDFDYLQQVFWGEAKPSSTKTLEWTYSDWTSVGQGRFPQQIQFTLRPTSLAYTATFNLSNIQEGDAWESRTEVPLKYTPVSVDAVLNAIMSVAK